ncbi:MAG: magnesium transporter [Planctomycetota bacterium]|jgi:magnesium transporter
MPPEHEDNPTHEHDPALTEEASETVILDAQSPHEESDEAVAALIEADAPIEEIARGVEEQDAPDAADTLEDLEPEASAEVVRQMEDESAAEALSHMDLALAATNLRDQEPSYSARLLGLMDPDDAADLLQEIPQEDADAILHQMPRRIAAKLGQLALYEPDTAGGLMTTDLIKLTDHDTVSEGINRIRAAAADDAELYYLYVTDAEGRLRGVVQMRSLLLSQPETRIADVMLTDIVALKTSLDQEEVARAFDRYDHLALPVIDDDDRLMGVVTIDDVIDTIRAEHTEDALKQVGAGASESVRETIRTKIRSRTPWLVVNLITAQAAAIVVLFFTDLIDKVAMLAVLMPVIANQAGNAGNQSLAVTLRGLVLGDIRKDRVSTLLLRETIFGLLTGMLTGAILGGVIVLLGTSGVIDIEWKIGIITALAMSGSLAAGCLVGTAIPIIMERFRFDPATASTIFLMMLTDMISFATFLGLAWLLQQWLLGPSPVP